MAGVNSFLFDNTRGPLGGGMPVSNGGIPFTFGGIPVGGNLTQFIPTANQSNQTMLNVPVTAGTNGSPIINANTNPFRDTGNLLNPNIGGGGFNQQPDPLPLDPRFLPDINGGLGGNPSMQPNRPIRVDLNPQETIPYPPPDQSGTWFWTGTSWVKNGTGLKATLPTDTTGRPVDTNQGSNTIVNDPTLNSKPPTDLAMPLPPTPTPKPPYIPPSNSRIYTRIDYSNDVVEQTRQVVTRGLWGTDSNNSCASGPTGSLSNFYSASYQTATQRQYYIDVLSIASANKCDVEFSVAYGHYQGSGSYAGGGQLNDSPSRAIYSQYLLLTDQIQQASRFTNNDGTSMDDIYVINISKSRLKDKLDPGNWELTLSELNGGSYANNVYTSSVDVKISGSAKVIKLVDDSLDSDETVSTGGITQPRYKIYSGSISNGIYSTGSHYGYMYPDLGVILLDAAKLDSQLSFNTVTGSNIQGNNAFKLFTSISGSATTTGSRTQEVFTFDARNVKLKTTANYFLRVKNYEYNYSNNPTFISGSEGEFKHSTFVQDPKTYITSIGLYNDRYDLLAVAKMSSPILKSFVNETNVTVKLEY